MNLRNLFLFAFIIFSLKAFLFADYDINAAGFEAEDAFYEEITDLKVIGEQSSDNLSKLDINGLLPSDYDKNGWAQRADGKWVASPTGALYKGQEEKNLSFLISSVIYEMSDEEKGMLKASLLYGKDLEKKLGNFLDSPEKLAEYGKDVTAKWVTDQLDAAFTKGTGFMDTLTGKKLNYGKHLDVVINEVLVKSLKSEKPKFTQDAKTDAGAIQRENWIVENLLDFFIINLNQEDRMQFAKEIIEELEWSEMDFTQDVITAFTYGGLVVAKKTLKFNFYKFASMVTKKVTMFLLGRSVPFAVYMAQSVFIKAVFGTLVPVITIIMTVKLLTDIPGMVNQREYDKYIPAVFMIGLKRLSKT